MFNSSHYYALFANNYLMNIWNKRNFKLGTYLIPTLIILGACSDIGLNTNPVIDRGLYSGPVTYRKYTYLRDSSEPKLDISVITNEVRLKEDKKGLFIENNNVNYYFDIENNIEITTDDGYIKYKRTNKSIEVNNRTESKYTDSTVVSLGNGTLEKE